MKRRRRRKLDRPEQMVAATLVSAPARSAYRWWLHAGIVLALLLANLGVYQRAINLGFLSVDDPDYVQNNPYLEKLDGAKLKHLLTAPYFANYAPVNLLSYALDVAVAGGKKPLAIHLSNVLWHGWVVGMVYLLALTIRPRVIFAAAAASLFLLHPVHVEVVAWVSSRKDLVATGFAALSMTCYLKYRGSEPERGNSGPQRRPADRSPGNVITSGCLARPVAARQTGASIAWYLGSLFSFLLASAAKQSVLLLPAVMLLWDVLVERRRSWRMIVDKIAFGFITLFFGWMTWYAQPSTNQAFQPFVVAATELTNLWLLTGLGQYTLYHAAPAPAAWSPAARLLIIAAAAGIWALPLLLPKARQPIRAALGYWVLIQMVPPMLLSFIVPITDRYLFLPSVGVCILLADIAAGLAGQPETKWETKWAGWGLLAALAAFWAGKTRDYVGEWCDPRSVWYGAHLKTKNSQVFQFLGEVYQNAGERIDGFIKRGTRIEVANELPLARAVVGEPQRVERLRAEWVGATTARTNSMAYRDQLWTFAWEQFEESVARRGTLSAPNLFMTRGRLLVSQGKAPQAIAEFQKALAFAQNSSYDLVRSEGATHALFAIGVAYWNMGNYPEARQWLLQAQAVQRKSGQAWLPTLDQEVERIKALAEGQSRNPPSEVRPAAKAQ